MSAVVPLKWLETIDDNSVAVTWGVPWKQGELKSADDLSLLGGNGKAVSMSSWVTARWPDKSVKWSAHGAVLDGSETYSIAGGNLSATPGAEKSASVRADGDGEGFAVDAGRISCRVPKAGAYFIRELKLPGKKRGMNGKVSCKIRHIKNNAEEDGVETSVTETCRPSVETSSVEQISRNRICVKSEGKLSLKDGSVPFYFVLRLYFYAESDDLKIVFSVICDADQEKHELAGLSLDFDFPLSGELHNRHVAFAGDEGLFTEAARLLLSMRGQGDAFYREQAQLRQVKLVPYDERSQWFVSKLDKAAVWKNFRLDQTSADSFHISKRTEKCCSRVWAVSGKRSRGMLYLSGEDGGAAFSVRDFWQKFPGALEADALDDDYGKARIWLWSDTAQPYNFGPYDTKGHGLDFAYEGDKLSGSDPRGIANTSEISIRLYDAPPPKEELNRFAFNAQKNAVLVCSPARYHESRALGVWALPDPSRAVPEKMDRLVSELCDFYIRQIEGRGWYGFWNYGDIMHSYDPVRHAWRYDFGGCAWHNTELGPNLWLWHEFLRTGNPKIYEFARIMTRHTSEVDCFHIGELKGLGSRHNVVHWGCSAKESRIMQAFYHRPYYFLSADERTGEIMDIVKDADYTAYKKDPMAMYFGGQHPGFSHVRSGPDWLAWASNWMSQYERFGSEKYMEKLLTGLKSLEDDKIGLLAGPTFLYNPDDGRLVHFSDNNYHYHMVIAFGGSEVLLELERWLDGDKRLKEIIAMFGKGYTMSNDEIKEFTGGRVPDKHEMSDKVYAAHIVAYAAKYYRDPKLGAIAWELIIKELNSISRNGSLNTVNVNAGDYPVPVEEVPGLSSNNAAQLSLAYFAVAELIPEYMPGAF